MTSMLALALLILAVTVVTGDPVPASGIRVGPNFKVILSELEDGRHQYTDIVHGARSCGGPGKLLTMRYEACDSSPRPCQVPSDDKMRRADLHFVPSRDMSSLGVRLIVSTKDISPTVVFDKIFDNNEMYKGNMYSVSTEIAACKTFQGKILTAQLELYKENDGIEVCTVADFFII